MLLTNSIFSLMCFDGLEDPNTTAGGGSAGTKTPEELKVEKRLYDQAVADAKAERAKRQAHEKELNDFREAKRLADEKAARDAGDFETLLNNEREKTAAEAAKAAKLAEDVAARDARDLERNKFGALVKALGGKSIHEKFHSLIDLDRIIVGPDGKIDPGSVTKYATEFQNDYPMIFTQDGQVNFPNNAPGKPGAASNWDSEPVTRKNLKEKKAILSSSVEEYKRKHNIK